DRCGMTTDDMIERVARAMWEGERPHQGMAGVTSWDDIVRASDDLSAEVRTQWRRQARWAIEAMREPTEEMVLAGVHHDNIGDMAGRWRAMIDAALGHQIPPPAASEREQSAPPNLYVDIIGDNCPVQAEGTVD